VLRDRGCVIFQHLNSLYLRLLLPLGGTVLVAMAVAWAIALNQLTRAIEERLDEQLRNATAILAEGTFPFSEDLIGRLDRLIAARILLLDDAGRIGLSTGGEAVNRALAGFGTQNARSFGVSPRFVTLESGGLAWRAAVRPLPAARDDRFRYVVAAASLAETRRVANEAALLLGGAMLMAAVIVALLGSFFTRSITRPIAKLAHMADRIAEGHRDVVVDVAQRNEIGVLARALNDMSARLAEYEQELARQSRLSGVGDLAARMAHEVRNPLTAMKMQLELLEGRIGAEDGRRVGGILDEVRRLELIVSSTLALGGARAGNPVPTDLPGLIRDVAELLQPSLAHRGIDLACDLGTMPAVAADPDQVKQVLLNLINNAADELAGGGRIVVSASLDNREGEVCISVDDSGPGLPAADEPRTQKPLGLGVGLAISEEIAARHGGTLERGRSTTLGGARFTLRLPVSI
ncbi:MAG TPA: HAMP domain-containing sensor histidine kinase, partial [Woeseiaceae bacterium]|nr:HAMP domain-containing sensor histidine kinase [Woeseiaceae bacterium]